MVHSSLIKKIIRLENQFPSKIIKCIFYLFFIVFFYSGTEAQSNIDTTKKNQNWDLHFQNTIITQYHPAFYAAYSGQNSLNPKEETNASVTATVFLGVRPWHGAEVYFNPELSGGSGFSRTLGLAGFPNGEVYRVDNPSPKIYNARLYIKQVFSLNNDDNDAGKMSYRNDDINQLGTFLPQSYIAIYAGKFSMMDFFDCNKYSHDPRTQFYNWALMGNPAWDYPANTRGYTNGLVVELVKPEWALRIGAVMVPNTANGQVMDPKILKSNSETMEVEQNYHLGNQFGKIRLFGYLTLAQMGNYKEAINWGRLNDTTPNINAYHTYGRTKYGFGLNIEHTFGNNAGLFFRSGWNDGHNETWAFTEIDRHVSIGLSLNGEFWKRKDDKLGIAQVANGISNDHRDFLAAGGYGFIIGDGKLNYGLEYITEIYYSFQIPNHNLWLTPDYQFILHPAYNKDRGPVHAFAVRLHVEI